MSVFWQWMLDVLELDFQLPLLLVEGGGDDGDRCVEGVEGEGS
jgi:hypothetical protein